MGVTVIRVTVELDGTVVSKQSGRATDDLRVELPFDLDRIVSNDEDEMILWYGYELKPLTHIVKRNNSEWK